MSDVTRILSAMEDGDGQAAYEDTDDDDDGRHSELLRNLGAADREKRQTEPVGDLQTDTRDVPR